MSERYEVAGDSISSVLSVFGITFLTFSNSQAYEYLGLMAGVLALMHLRRSVPFFDRLGYALFSALIGTVLAPGLSDTAQIFWGSMPDSMRGLIGLLSVGAAMPFYGFWRGIWRNLADHPEAFANRIRSWVSGDKGGNS